MRPSIVTWLAVSLLVSSPFSALSLAQTNRAIARAADLQRQADQRRQTLWLLFFVAFSIGVWIAMRIAS